MKVMKINEKVSSYLKQLLKVQKVSGLTPKEIKLYEDGLRNHIVINKGQDWLDKDDITLTSKEEGDFMVDMDKEMIHKACNHMAKSIYNYRRKLFGIGSTPDAQRLVHFITELMKEQLPISYPNYEAIEKFWGRYNPEN
jgi:hypothetical protein